MERQQFHVCSIITPGAESVVSWLNELPGPNGYTAAVQEDIKEQEPEHTEGYCIVLLSKLTSSQDSCTHSK